MKILSIKDKYYVERIAFQDCKEWLLYKHYAKRIPSISYAFGLFDNDNILQGVCTFGTPASSTLLKGVCGEEYKEKVKELNRLVLNENMKNLASFFVSKCFKLLEKSLIIVSYADTSKNHTGYIYQALNFYYTGLSILTYDPVIKGQENKHHATSGVGRGLTKKQMVEKFGNNVFWKKRDRKHRYIYFIGNKKEKKEMLKALKYEIKPYPKGENKNYDASYKPTIQGRLF